jgi:hypothetical protein
MQPVTAGKNGRQDTLQLQGSKVRTKRQSLKALVPLNLVGQVEMAPTVQDACI